MTKSAEIALPGPVLATEGWEYADYVTAWQQVESFSSWARVRLAGAVETTYAGKLRQYAEDCGVAYSTMKGYRSIDAAYPVQRFGRPNLSVGVAEALMAQPDRLELAARGQPWTVAEARELAAARREPEAIGGEAEDEALTPVTAAEKAAADAAYAPFAGEDGDFHAGMAARAEAVRACREEHLPGHLMSALGRRTTPGWPLIRCPQPR